MQVLEDTKSAKLEYAYKDEKIRILGVIPAKSRSTRLPEKNLIELTGKPLFTYVTKVSLHVCDKTIVSTDSKEIKEIALKLGAEIIDRKPELCQDDTPSFEIAKDIAEQYDFEIMCFIEPTMPLLSDATLLKMLDAMLFDKQPAIITVNKTLKPTGTALCIRKDILMKEKTLFPKGMAVFIVSFEEGMDIDYIWDLRIAEALMGGKVYD